MATTTMVATGGFGTFPENTLTQTFQEVVSENISEDFLQPLNSYLEVVSAPTIEPKPDSVSDAEPPLNLLSAFDELISFDTVPAEPLSDEAIVETAVASIGETQTQIASTTPGLPTGTTLPTQTISLSSATAPASATVSAIPSATFAPIIVQPSRTSQPADPPTFTPTFTPTVSPAGFSLTNVKLNNTLLNGGAVFAWADGYGDRTFTVNFDYAVWAASNCPGCIIQLVAGTGSAGVGTTTCAYNAQPGISPGASGSSATVTVTAPAAPGTYDVVVQLIAQPDCASAIATYTGTSGIYQKIGEVVVHNSIVVMYTAGGIYGNFNGRFGADSLCTGNKPSGMGNTNIHGFVSISTSDTIANLPANYGINTNIPIIYNGGPLVAKNWTDLLDGSINARLDLSGIIWAQWWSGSESNAGDSVLGTANCNAFTSAASSDYGNFGLTNTTGAGWLSDASSMSCDTINALLCVAGP